MTTLVEWTEWITENRNTIFVVCLPIILIYAGYYLGTRDKFTKLRRKVLYMRKHASHLRANPYILQEKMRGLNNEINRARNFDKITELERIYLTDSLQQVLYVPVRYN